MTAEQRLAAVLVERMKYKDFQSSAAIAILGRARISYALPLLVNLMLHEEELRSSCLKSIVLFGNLAVEPIEQELKAQRDLSDIPVKTFLEPLFLINTGYAAVSIARLFDRYHDDQSQEAIATTLALMLEQPLIEGELLDLTDNEAPTSVRAQPLQARTNWVSRGGKEPSVSSDILRIPGPLDVIFRPWGFRGNEVRSQPTR
jgi:hypothetical protein